MLKIHKGLKKKKKDKKHKREKEEELFDEAELERYRKEHQRALEHPDNADDPSNENNRSTSNSSSLRDNDEWKKFQALTAGVDTILQKTQEDLDRIKSTSFFQRKTVTCTSGGPAAEQNEDSKTEKADDAEPVTHKPGKKSAAKSHQNRVNTDEREDDDRVSEVTKFSKTKKRLDTENERQQKEKEAEFDNLEEQFTETENVSDEDVDEEDNDVDVDDDSIFNTSYVDAATSGDLKLAYIPDSPTTEVDNDYDPFDTSIADKFIISNPKKRYLNLGCAVEVLSGQIEKSKVSPTVLPKSTKRRIVKPVELLLPSFDESEGTEAVKTDLTEDFSTTRSIESPVKTLLDEDLAFTPAEPCYPLTTSLYPPVKNSESKVEGLDLNDTPSLPPLESTFVEVLVKNSSVDSVDDEFAQLAAESLAKKPTAESAPLPSAPHSGEYKSPTFESLNTVTGDQFEPDPFDTLVAERSVTSASTETPLQKGVSGKAPQAAELLAAIEDDDFDPRASSAADDKNEDIFKDESPISRQFNEILSPVTFDEDTAFEDEIDPFDTSYVNGLPGKAELKLIEKELIESE